MNKKHIGLVSCAGLLLLCVFIGIASVTISSAEVTELNVPPEVVQGEALSISGKAVPNEEVWLKSSFAISLPVSGGKYSREFTGIHFPEGEKTFSVTAEDVNNIRISLSPVFWQTVEYPLGGPKNATSGIATLSVSFPAEMYGIEMDIHGKKDVKVYGDAADDATAVNQGVAMSIKVTADANGDFELDISTEGVPVGEFLITAGGKEKTVEVVLTEPTPTPTPTPSPTPTPTSNGGDESGDGDGTPDTTPTPSPSPSSSPTPTSTSTPTTTFAPTATPAAASPTVTPASPAPVTPSPSPTPSPSASPSQRWIPGFEAVFAIAGLLAVAYLVLRRKRE